MTCPACGEDHEWVCLVCEFADQHGYWGQPGTHCRDCHLSWTSSSQIHCVQCHRQFHSPAALQAHQPIGFKCIDPAEHAVFAARSRENCSGTVWVLEAPESLKRLRVTPETGP